jgi:hypothetical protein
MVHSHLILNLKNTYEGYLGTNIKLIVIILFTSKSDYCTVIL